MEEVDKCVGDGLWVDVGDIADDVVGDDFLEAAHVGDEHRFLEVEGHLGDAALGGRPVGLHDDVGGVEEVFDLFIADIVVAENHFLLESESLNLFYVGLFLVVELSCHDESDGQCGESWVGEGIDEEVETFIGADEAEEEHIAIVGVESDILQGQGSILFGAVVVVEGVRTEAFGFVLFIEMGHIVEDSLREGDEAVHGFDEVRWEAFIEDRGFVGHHIMDESDAFRYFVTVDDACHLAVAGSEERHPVGEDDDIGFLFSDGLPYFVPVEGVDGVDGAL